MKSFNLNSFVKVKLTEIGRSMIIDHIAESLVPHGHTKNDIKRTFIDANTDENGIFEIQFHELMTYFGGDFSGSHFAGGTKMPFTSMSVLIDDKDLKDVTKTEVKLKKPTIKDDKENVK